MAIVQNANEEHQFLFAVNTISMVKSDALFSYIAPTNIIGWLLIPLRFFMPFCRFVKLNRTIIKITHMPILFSIFFYERVVLSNFAYGPTDLVEQRGRTPAKMPAFSIRGPGDLFSPGTRLREPSITTFRKDRALEEVFRRPFKDPNSSQVNVETGSGKRKSSNIVRDWMQGMGHDGGASSPLEQPRSVLDQLESRRPKMRSAVTSQRFFNKRRQISGTRSVASDPEELIPFTHTKPQPIQEEEDFPDMSMDDLPQQTDADGDDELVTNDEDDRGTLDRAVAETDHDSHKENLPRPSYHSSSSSDEEKYFRTPLTAKPHTPAAPASLSSTALARQPQPSSPLHPPRPSHPKRAHNRNLSTNTVVFSPTQPSVHPSRAPSPTKRSPPTHSGIAPHNGTATPTGRRTPKRARPVLPPRALHPMHPNLSAILALAGPSASAAGFTALPTAIPQRRSRSRTRSFNARALDLASDLGDNRHGPDALAFPASFNTQLELAAATAARRAAADEDAGMVSRIMLARMTTLEEGFRDVLREVKGLRREDGGTSKGGSKGGSKGRSSVEEGAVRMRGKGRKKGERRDGWEERVGSSV